MNSRLPGVKSAPVGQTACMHRLNKTFLVCLTWGIAGVNSFGDVWNQEFLIAYILHATEWRRRSAWQTKSGVSCLVQREEDSNNWRAWGYYGSNSLPTISIIHRNRSSPVICDLSVFSDEVPTQQEVSQSERPYVQIPTEVPFFTCSFPWSCRYSRGGVSLKKGGALFPECQHGVDIPQQVPHLIHQNLHLLVLLSYLLQERHVC